MKKNIICITCPVGCIMEVEGDSGKVLSITGNQCPRGRIYGETEFLHPQRILTSTVKVHGATEPLVPVRSRMPISKELQMACIGELRKTVLAVPVEPGQVVIADIFGTGVDIVATGSAVGPA